MNRKEINLFNMARATEQLIENNYETLKAYPPVIDSYNRIKSLNVLIAELHKQQSVGTKVKSELKNLEKDELDALTLKIADATKAYAVSVNNTELKFLVSLEKSTLKRLRQVNYHVKIQAIYNAALSVADKLAMWGVTPEDVELLNTKSITFKNRTPEIRNSMAVTKQASTDIRAQITKVKDEIHNTLDPLMKPFNTMQPTLYGQYMNARMIVDTAATQAKKNGENAGEAKV